jgi:hypothetical protein
MPHAGSRGRECTVGTRVGATVGKGGGRQPGCMPGARSARPSKATRGAAGARPRRAPRRCSRSCRRRAPQRAPRAPPRPRPPRRRPRLPARGGELAVGTLRPKVVRAEQLRGAAACGAGRDRWRGILGEGRRAGPGTAPRTASPRQTHQSSGCCSAQPGLGKSVLYGAARFPSTVLHIAGLTVRLGDNLPVVNFGIAGQRHANRAQSLCRVLGAHIGPHGGRSGTRRVGRRMHGYSQSRHPRRSPDPFLHRHAGSRHAVHRPALPGHGQRRFRVGVAWNKSRESASAREQLDFWSQVLPRKPAEPGRGAAVTLETSAAGSLPLCLASLFHLGPLFYFNYFPHRGPPLAAPPPLCPAKTAADSADSPPVAPRHAHAPRRKARERSASPSLLLSRRVLEDVTYVC